MISFLTCTQHSLRISISYIIYSEISSLTFFLRLHLFTHFHVDMLFLLIMCKYNDAFATFLNDTPKKYNYNPQPIIYEGALFLEPINKIVILNLYVFPS